MKKRTAALVAALIALGGVAVAAPASAHTGGVAGVAECKADGTYTVTWTYTATNVPEGVEAETKAMTTTPGTLAPIDGVAKGGQVYLSVWSDHQVNVPGAPVKTGNWSATFATVGIPGSHVGKVTTMVQTDWRNGPSEDPVGEVSVDGTCKPDEPEPTPTPTETPEPTPTPTETTTPEPTPSASTPAAAPPSPSPSATLVPVADTGTPDGTLPATGPEDVAPWLAGGVIALALGAAGIALDRRRRATRTR